MSVIARPLAHLVALLAAALALMALASAPTATHAAEYKTFGAELSRTANSSYTCDGAIPYSFRLVPTTSCTWWGIGSAVSTAESFVVPYPGGTVRKVRVKVGAVTGRMQVVVIGLIRQSQSLANPGCCFYRRASDVFTPRANATTEIDLALPVTHALNAQTNTWDYDTLALSVLDPGVPVPASDTGDASGLGIGSAALYPAFTGGERVDTFALAGFQVLMQADIELGAEPGTGGGGGDGTAGAGTPRIARVMTPRGRVLADVICDAGGPCTGTARITARRTRATEHAARVVTLGSTRYTVAAGTRKRVTVRLSRAGRNYVKARSSRVRATLQLRNAAGTVIRSRAVTIRA